MGELMDKRPLTTVEAAEYLKMSPGTLRMYRMDGKGPKFHKLPNGLIRYYVEDLEAYVRGGDK